MPKVKLTDRTVKATRLKVEDGTTVKLPPDEGVAELWDVLLPGLALRIGYGGRRTYTVTTRVNGRQVRRKIGTTDTHKLSEAREVARDILRNAAKGIDSHSRRAIKRNALREAQETVRADTRTFQAVAEAWLADPLKKGGANLRSKGQIEARLKKRVYPRLGALPIREIDGDDISALLDDIATEYPILANRVLADIRRVFNWAVRKKRLDVSPASGIEPPAEEQSRERVLSNDEIGLLWRACDRLGHPIGSIYKLLLLLGARRNEVGEMKWAEIDGDTWKLPSDRAKNKTEHVWPLSTAAKEILDATPRMNDSEFVFPAQRKGRDPETGERTVDKAVSAWGAFKDRLDRAIAEVIAADAGEKVDMAKHALKPWRTHDVRRSVVTAMNETLGIEPHIIEAIIGHRSGAATANVAGVYNRATYLEQRKNALQRWAEHVEAIATGKPAAAGDNVAQLKPRRA